jgi:capsular polysaccharide transport system ATP-binding protein
MKSRLAFGVSMAIPFDTYLVDEVTSVGDAAFRAKSTTLFRARMETSGAFVVNHNMGLIRELCDVGVVLENGVATYYADLEEAIARHEDILRVDPNPPPEAARPNSNADPNADSNPAPNF